jgi:hypothetical protein
VVRRRELLLHARLHPVLDDDHLIQTLLGHLGSRPSE